MGEGLTPKQARFVEEYLIDLNASQAARRAGYSEKTAHRTGAENMQKPLVRAAIDAAIAERSQRTKITQDMVLDELAKLGFSNALDYMAVASDGGAYVDLSKLTRDQAAAISEITSDEYVEGSGESARDVRKTKVKLHDKRQALVDIGKHLGMFVDRVKGDFSFNVTLESDAERL